MAEFSNEEETGSDCLTKRTSGQVVVVDNVAFADAVSKSNVRPFSKRMLQLYCFCFVATLNSCINGYDGSLMGAINAMKPYQKQFGMTTTGASTGFVFAIYTVGNLVGSFVAGPLTVSRCCRLRSVYPQLASVSDC